MRIGKNRRPPHGLHKAGRAKTQISNIKFDKIIVWENGGNGNGQTATSNFLQGMSRSLPPMLQVMKDVGGVEVPEYLAKLQADAAPPVVKVEPTANGHAAKVEAS